MQATQQAATSREASPHDRRHRPAAIPIDPDEYERRRRCAQMTVDRVHGPRRYRVLGEPGQMIRLVPWNGSAMTVHH